MLGTLAREQFHSLSSVNFGISGTTYVKHENEFLDTLSVVFWIGSERPQVGP